MREAIIDLGRGGAVYELEHETFDAKDVGPCDECHDTAPGGKVLKFFTRRGARVRLHDGFYCSTDCHDRHHGLKAR